MYKVAKSACALFYDETFIDKLDNDRNTINFMNGIVDLRNAISGKELIKIMQQNV